MCSLPNIQPRDLQEFLQPRTKQIKKPEAETVEIFVPDSTMLLQRI